MACRRLPMNDGLWAWKTLDTGVVKFRVVFAEGNASFSMGNPHGSIVTLAAATTKDNVRV
jgi:hypothetical protein